MTTENFLEIPLRRVSICKPPVLTRGTHNLLRDWPPTIKYWSGDASIRVLATWP